MMIDAPIPSNVIVIFTASVAPESVFMTIDHIGLIMRIEALAGFKTIEMVTDPGHGLPILSSQQSFFSTAISFIVSYLCNLSTFHRRILCGKARSAETCSFGSRLLRLERREVG